VVKEIQRINEKEARLGSTTSWHDAYKDSAYIFIGACVSGVGGCVTCELTSCLQAAWMGA
jgi:hypothetical protein